MKARIGMLSLALCAASNKDSTAPTRVTRVSIAPSTAASLPVGDSMRVTATKRDAQANLLTGRAVAWASSEAATATVRAIGSSPEGMVTAVRAGNVAVSLSAPIVAVRGGNAPPVAARPDPMYSLRSRRPVGSVRVSVVLRDPENRLVLQRPITYAISDIAAATVSGTGLVIGAAPGTATIRATSDGKSGEATITVLPPPVQHAFLWTAADGLKDLGVLPGFTRSDAWAINAGGQVVGNSSGGEGAAFQIHAVLWTPTGELQDLGTLPGFAYSTARAINSLGQVAGHSVDPQNNRGHAVLWSATGVIQDLGTLPGDQDSAAYGINDAGQVVGESYGVTGSHAFVWTEAGGMVDPLAAFSTDGVAFGINGAGTIVGRSGLQPLRLSATGVRESLAFLAGDMYANAYAINDAGVAVGASFREECAYDCNPPEPGADHAMLWTTEGGVINLGALPGFDPLNSVAIGLNNRGQVVGSSRGRAYLWSQAEGFVDLGVLVGSSFSLAAGVNDAGQVVGSSW
ncbi:MAG TPA: Ig-like domain-containing protein [Gemmatimonadaceae bacterium]|nr:Ig-like domain-containing protein [Gemmatimonadaceae bacterium]